MTKGNKNLSETQNLLNVLFLLVYTQKQKTKNKNQVFMAKFKYMKWKSHPHLSMWPVHQNPSPSLFSTRTYILSPLLEFTSTLLKCVIGPIKYRKWNYLSSFNNIFNYRTQSFLSVLDNAFFSTTKKVLDNA